MDKSHLWILFGVGAALSWGAWGILNKLALPRVGWPGLVLASAVIYVVAAVPITIWAFPKSGAVGWGLALLAAAAGTAGMFLFYAAYRGGTKPASAVVPLTALYPAVTAVVGVWVLKEKLAPAQIVGVLLAVVASVLIATGE